MVQEIVRTRAVSAFKSALALIGFGVIAACSSHEIDLDDPTGEEVAAALEKFALWGNAVETGRWSVATSDPSVELKGLEPEARKRLIEFGKTLNTETWCRASPFPSEIDVALFSKIEARDGCKVERLAADKGYLFWRSACVGDTRWVYKEFEAKFARHSFSVRQSSWVSDSPGGEPAGRVLLHEGERTGSCSGGEYPWQSFEQIWTDRANRNSPAAKQANARKSRDEELDDFYGADAPE